MKKRKLGLSFLLIIIILAILFFDRIVNFIINIMWFKEVNYLSIYFTKILAVIKLMIPMFIIIFIVIYFYCKTLKTNIDNMSDVIDVIKNPLRKKRFILANIIISLIISYTISSTYWYRILQFTNSTNFNIKDPIFHKDISFFIFKLPLIQSLYGAAVVVLAFLIIITLVLYFTMNTRDKFSGKDLKNIFKKNTTMKSSITKFAGKQLAIVSALMALLVSLGYIIKGWNLLYDPTGVVYGAGYTDANITLIFYRIISITAIIASIVIFISVIKGKIKPIIISIVFIFLFIIGEGITSSVLQRFLVKSNEITLERPYIENNINYTRKAFNIDNINENIFEVKNTLKKEDIQNNSDIINNIRINSYIPSLEFYNQVQVIRYYYDFNDVDIDRYNINGKNNQVFIAPREINQKKFEGNANTWQNKHLIYTHGYGIVMSKVNSVTEEGQPDFLIKDIPPENSTDIDIKEPRIYFGEKTNEYAIVNTDINEFDYPQGGNNEWNKYSGNAGIKMNLINRILFAVNERNINFILSQAINSDSKILINRNIIDRVKKIAPFLSYDKDPYIVINDGKLYWIIDAYTTSNMYPYSQPYNGVNYIRNSIKVVIDAFNGDTNFYIIDKNDPIALSYAKIFPSLFKDINTLSKDIQKHFRYPEDLFDIQCNVLGKYHITDPGVFYNEEDLWEVSTNQKKIEGEKEINEGYYVTMKLPNSQKEEMILLEYFNMRNKNNMVALLAARMDDENYGKMSLYKFPPQKTIYSPYLFKQKILQDPLISKEISLWNKEGSEIVYGDTIIIPINQSLLYVNPIYLRATGEKSIPEMKRVVIFDGEKIVMAENIDKALEQMFNYNKVTEDKKSSNLNENINSEFKEKIKSAKEYFDKAVEAQKNGDWAKYGEYIKSLQNILEELNK
ncbi:hypothetical protein SAMN05428976_11550 [Clostridium sp. USBA 49]|jgi:hypothetical protein|uniref:UPF0182 family protein n=1 Tax=Clostridium TaxID=1485 RepID=UPI00099A3339|nr:MULTISPECIES: UPF0182 family protein [Clostridium]SKA90942.1 hypothetical protein SAMN05428976_11550 [Clostridium sp. USBA 49]